MSLETYIPSIEQYCLKLQNLYQNNPIQLQVLSILEHIKGNPTNFELVACKQTPFYQEFFTTIKEQCINEDTCFTLLECLIIFCREKQLRSGKKDDLPLPEQNILDFYEKSDLWAFEDGTLLHLWYWHLLPKSYENA